MKTPAIAITLAVFGLAGCGMATSLSRPYIEPSEGSTAKVRVISNGSVRFMPNRNCVDWNAPDIGTVVSAENFIGKSPTHNGKKIGMKGEASKEYGYVSAEVLVKADTPLTLYFRSESSDGHFRYWCNPISIAFIPLAGEEYEVLGAMDERCNLYAKSLSKPGQYPAQKVVAACK